MWLQMKGLEHFGKSTLRKKCPKAEFFLVCIFLYSVPIQKNTNQKKLRIWTLFTQCKQILILRYYLTHFRLMLHFYLHWKCEKILGSLPLSVDIKIENLEAVTCLDLFCQNCVLKNFSKFTGKQLCQSLFLIKFNAWSLQLYWKRDSRTDVFLWILRNFLEHLFNRTLLVGASED